ncbi:hypothetical protein [Streptomyces marincola]|uniref:hypothetical protein n=1 Tax=Streptomyces marincola TaxID=2878388 RepID=UPI001CF44532|nr:hypothetical protein [Streptomyces marincola]UCM91270.1 hypothetical protein LC193_26835 [Streptomyces marincola]
MTGFLLGVLSSILATVVLGALAWLRSARFHWWLLGLLSQYSPLGLRRVYRKQRSTEKDIKRDLAKARWVKVLAGRGNALTRDAFAPLWRGDLSVASVRILLPDPEGGPNSWLQRREGDLRQIDRGFAEGVLAEQVRVNTRYLSRVAEERSGIEVRSFDLPHLWRVVATDQVAYLTFYPRFSHGRNAPCLYARAPGLLYDMALRLFDSAWSGSAPPRL